MKLNGQKALGVMGVDDFDQNALMSRVFDSPFSIENEFDTFRFSQVLYALKNVSSMVVILKPDGTVAWVSETFDEDEESDGNLSFSMESFVSEFSDHDVYKNILESVLLRGSWQSIVTCGTEASTQKQWLKMMVTPSERFGNEIMGVFYDLSDIDVEQLSFQNHDFFSGIYSLSQLRYDVATMSKNVKCDERLHLVVLAIRNITDIVYLRGQDHVDLLYYEFSRQLRQKLSAKVDIYRVSNSEIGLLTSSKLGTQELLDRFNQFLLENEYHVITEGYEYHLKLHGGLSTLNPQFDDFNSLLRNAVLAKEAAEEQNTPIEAHSIDDMVKHIEDLTMASNFYQALYNNELHMVYQPIVNQEGKIWGVEALIRWTTAQNESINPMKIIEYAERSGNMIRLGYWIIKRVFHDYNMFIKEKFADCVISINLSLEQFKDENMASAIAHIASHYGIDPNKFIFEVTETHSFNNMNQVVPILSSLRDQGFRVALDDFGVGYSTILNLVDLPIDIVKLDKSLITSIKDNPTREKICNAVVTLATSLGLLIIAEGVEVYKDKMLISHLQVDLMQGYYYYKPLSLDAFCNVL